MAQIDVADENLVKLLQIQHVVNTEEELESSLDEVLTRVLDFYRMFVRARNESQLKALHASIDANNSVVSIVSTPIPLYQQAHPSPPLTTPKKSKPFSIFF